jgi:hypothetical protein
MNTRRGYTSSSSRRWCALFTLSLAGGTVFTSSLFAQVAAPALGPAVAAEVAGAPTSLAARSSRPWQDVRVALPSFVETAPPRYHEVFTAQARARVSTNVAMMGVGGAVLIVGLIMGGEDGATLATAGSVVGLVGLYRYLH